MRLPTDPRIPPIGSPTFVQNLYGLFRDFAKQVNQLTEGQVQAATNAATTAPTTGTYEQGDVIRNRTPSEAGSPGSKYVVTGWVCVTAGTPGTWRELRCLTGN